MNTHKVQNLLISLFATTVLLTSNLAFAEATLPEVYQAVEAGKMAQAESMIKEVLQNHPNSAKAHYIAAELYLKEGKTGEARSHFLKAENLAPGLPFAQAESVRKLQTALAGGGAKSAPVNAGASSIFSSPVFWILMVILGAGILFFLRNRNRPTPVQVYNAPNAGGAAPYPGGPTPYPGGPAGSPGAPAAGGMGGGLMGSLATGAALGAGMFAGQALASHLMGGQHDAGNPGNTGSGMNQVGGPAAADPNVGVRDASSWDDASSSSRAASGGGDVRSDV